MHGTPPREATLTASNATSGGRGWPWMRLKGSRRGTKYPAEVPLCHSIVGDVDTGSATLHVPEQLTAVASGTERFVHNFTAKSLPRQVPRRTLDSLLDQAGITRIDLLSMDIELSEPAALRGFEVDRFRPRLVCIEAHGTRQAILDYFAAHGYVLVGKYLPHDRVNLYFKPRA